MKTMCLSGYRQNGYVAPHAQINEWLMFFKVWTTALNINLEMISKMLRQRVNICSKSVIKTG